MPSFLDEPSYRVRPAALRARSLLAARQSPVLARIHQLVRQKSQFIIATHSPIIMAYPEAKSLELTGNGIQPVSYTETEHFRVTRDFLNRHERMLRLLMEEAETE